MILFAVNVTVQPTSQNLPMERMEYMSVCCPLDSYIGVSEWNALFTHGGECGSIWLYGMNNGVFSRQGIGKTGGWW